MYIFLFLYAATSKMLILTAYKLQMQEQPLPKWSIPYLTYGIPFLEIVLSFLLAIYTTRLRALYMSTIMMFAFSIYIGLIRFHVFAETPCTCGGVLRKVSWTTHMIFNLFFVAIGAVAIILMHIKKETDEKQTNHKLSTSLGNAINRAT
jgi:hypothetical protein